MGVSEIDLYERTQLVALMFWFMGDGVLFICNVGFAGIKTRQIRGLATLWYLVM